MTPDRCRGSFHVCPALDQRNKKQVGKIRPNTVIIPHHKPQVNANMSLSGENLCPAQKHSSAFGKHSILKSWIFHVIL